MIPMLGFHCDEEPCDGMAVLGVGGATMTIRRNRWDARIVREVWERQVYTRGMPLPPEPVVVDAGAYIGDFSVFAARRLGARRVVAIEPVEENRAWLAVNVAVNGIEDTVETEPRAIGREGSLDLHVQLLPHREVHASAFRALSGAEVRRVPCLSVARVLEEWKLARVDLLKMDVEGAEYDALGDLDRETAERIDRVAFEAHVVAGMGEVFVALLDHLRWLGYEHCQRGSIVRAARGGVPCGWQ